MQRFSLHYHSFVLITPLYHPVRCRRPLSVAGLAITCVTGSNEQTSRWAPRVPSANSLVWLSIIFTKDVAGARLGRGWPSRLTNDQSDFFPGHPSFNYCGERRDRAGREYDTQILRYSDTRPPGQHNNNVSSHPENLQSSQKNES